MPWVSAAVPFAGTITRSGVDGGGDGLISIGLGAGLAVMAFGMRRGAQERRSAWVALACIVAAAGLALWENTDITGRIGEASDSELPISATHGPGLFVGGGVVAAFAGWGLIQVPPVGSYISLTGRRPESLVGPSRAPRKGVDV